MKTSIWLSLSLILLTAPGCYFGINDEDLRNISAADVRERLHDEPDTTVLVDARSPGEFVSGHIPGALSRPLPKVTRFDRPLSDSEMIIVYGSDFNDDRTPAVAKRLMTYEFKKIRAFRGGVARWTETDGTLTAPEE
ncbi:MAG: rhodanese-like domain-containing protein [Phycisphaeraceae bacterium]